MVQSSHTLFHPYSSFSYVAMSIVHQLLLLYIKVQITLNGIFLVFIGWHECLCWYRQPLQRWTIVDFGCFRIKSFLFSVSCGNFTSTTVSYGRQWSPSLNFAGLPSARGIDIEWIWIIHLEILHTVHSTWLISISWDKFIADDLFHWKSRRKNKKIDYFKSNRKLHLMRVYPWLMRRTARLFINF